MGDLVTSNSVLYTQPDGEYLMVNGRGHDLLVIPVRAAGAPASERRPEWVYEHTAGENILRIHPSLLVTSDPPPQFHTDYNWQTRFERLPADDPREAYTFFFELNPRRTDPA